MTDVPEMRPGSDRIAAGIGDARLRRLPVRLAATAIFVVTAAVNLPAPLYATYAAHAGLGTTASSLAFACYVAGLLPVLMLLSELSDRIGRRAPLLCALALSAGGVALLIVAPNIVSLGITRLFLGIATGLTTGSGPAYVVELLTHFEGHSASEANRRGGFVVTASTSLGFGMGALVTGLWLMASGTDTLTPGSYLAYLPLPAVAFVGLLTLPPRLSAAPSTSWMKLPTFAQGSQVYALAIANAWAVVGLVISVLPSALRAHGLTSWSGVMTFFVISAGFAAQPMSRRMRPLSSLRVGLLLGPTGFAIIMVGAWLPSIALLLAGAALVGFSAYGFTYLGGLTRIMETSSELSRSRSISGYFLFAYLGFSLPVVSFGYLADIAGLFPSLCLFLSTITIVSAFIWNHLGTGEKIRV